MTTTQDQRFTGPDLCAMPARTVVALLRSGEIGTEDVIAASAARIAQVEPAINAMPTVCADRARAKARDLPARAKSQGDHPGWLAGLPVGIKDLNPVEGVRTTWGSRFFADHIPDATDPLVARLESRGALVMGKTNTPEFGAGGNSTNPVFGATRNPWNTAMNAGGSSGGSAAALAAGEIWLAQGSDLMGSLRTPAAHCGVLGLRPSPGRCGGGPDGAAFLPEALQGPMARDVLDLALGLDAMAGHDPAMPMSLDAPATPFSAAAAAGLAHAPRIAFSEDQNGFAQVETEIRQVLRDAMAAVGRAGARITETCPAMPGLHETYMTLRALHYGAVVAQMPAAVQATFGPRLASNLAIARTTATADIFRAMSHRSTLHHELRIFLQSHDVLAIPVVGIAPAPVEQEFPLCVDGAPTGSYDDWLAFSFLATTTLMPALSLPVGMTAAGLPVAIQLIGPYRGEALLLQVARFIEEALNLPVTPIDPRSP
ncbi:MAG: amidase family protein [Rhodobacteraceae bacterium]|nr:amidase family protein [Paracoccaceae bacterium]